MDGASINFEDVLAQLAKVWPVFHSEADFQHALAWALHKSLPAANIRLEFKPLPQEPIYVDIWLVDDARSVALELEYWIRKIDVSVNGEQFNLRYNAASDGARYDAWKDAQRLEHIVDMVPNIQPA